MALVSSRFAERYAELTSHVPTLAERLLDVERREVCARREVEAQAQAAFQDVLHIASIMIADKRARQQGSTAMMDARALTLYKQETAVWFPAAPPRVVPFRANRPLRAFPHAAFKEICEEERELRQWLYGVERKLRENIEEARGRSNFYFNFIEGTVAKEHSGRQWLMREEGDAFTVIKQRFFRTVPVDYFRHVVLSRYGSSVSAALAEEPDLSLEAQEAKARTALCDDEVNARKEVFQYLQTAYDVRLFAVNHQEVIERYELEEAEVNALFPLVARACRNDFGGTFYHVPALALHLSATCPSLRALCFAHLEPAPPSTTTTAALPPAQPIATPDAEAVDSTPVRPTAPLAPPVSDAPAPEELISEEELAYLTSADTCEIDTPSAVDVTCTGVFPPAAEWEELGDREEEEAREKEKAKAKEKEWEVNTDPTPAVRETLYAYEDVLPVLYASDTLEPALRAVEEEAPRPVKGEADEAVAAAAAPTLSHNNSELTCSPQTLPKSIFTTEEIFVGDPFAESATLKKTKKSKKPKKSSKLSKPKKCNSEGPQL